MGIRWIRQKGRNTGHSKSYGPMENPKNKHRQLTSSIKRSQELTMLDHFYPIHHVINILIVLNIYIRKLHIKTLR